MQLRKKLASCLLKFTRTMYDKERRELLKLEFDTANDFANQSKGKSSEAFNLDWKPGAKTWTLNSRSLFKMKPWTYLLTYFTLVLEITFKSLTTIVCNRGAMEPASPKSCNQQQRKQKGRMVHHAFFSFSARDNKLTIFNEELFARP